jgi:aryl-alcohol dehydrogenase-like predicted oxidoreductase
METMVQEGKIRYLGISNHTVDQVAQFAGLAAREHVPHFAAVQNRYNIIDRELECYMFPLLRCSGLALLPYSPMDEGKLVRANAERDPATAELVREIDRVGVQVGATRPQVLLAWVLSHLEATCVVTGAESPEQVDENCGALGIVLPGEAISRLNAMSRLVIAQARAGPA